jgi:hypothetical protein
MKRPIILLWILLVSAPAFSQEAIEKLQRRITTGVDLFYDFWMDTPETISPEGFNWGANVYGLYNFPFSEKSNFSMALGLSYGKHKMYHDGILVVDSSGFSEFLNYDQEYPKLDYKKNKFEVNYLDFPIELRFLNDNGIRFSAGVRIGVLLQSKTKYRGDDYLFGSENQIKVKFLNLENIENYRVAATARIGWKWISLYGSYSITKVFTQGNGPDLYPISVGLSILPY